jgi:hypothetical protein
LNVAFQGIRKKMDMSCYFLPGISRNSIGSARAFRALVPGSLLLLLILSGCHTDSSSDDNDNPSEDTQSLSGVVYNGRIAGATVFITDDSPRDTQLQTTTAADGSFSLEVQSANPRYRVETRDGTLNGQSYQGQLVALCSDSPCDVTPFSTVVESMVRLHDFNTGDAKAHLASLLQFDGDPFARKLRGNPVPAKEWDMEGVRGAIDNGRGLQSWVTDMLDWIMQPGSPAPVGPIGGGAVDGDAGTDDDGGSGDDSGSGDDGGSGDDSGAGDDSGSGDNDGAGDDSGSGNDSGSGDDSGAGDDSGSDDDSGSGDDGGSGDD